MSVKWEHEKVDVYVCGKCFKGFSVERDIEPQNCPVCGSSYWEFSHEGTLQKED